MKARGQPHITDAASDSAAHATRLRIGETLRTLRKDHGLSLGEAAERSGLSRSFIGMVEQGNSEIALSRLIRLADVYGVFIADLFTSIRQTPEPELTHKQDSHRVPLPEDEACVEYLA